MRSPVSQSMKSKCFPWYAWEVHKHGYMVFIPSTYYSGPHPLHLLLSDVFLVSIVSVFIFGNNTLRWEERKILQDLERFYREDGCWLDIVSAPYLKGFVRTNAYV